MARLDEKHVIAIWGSPGSGKSTLAANMATILADSGYMTCLLSASDFGRLQTFFGTAIPRGKGIIAAVTSGRNVREALVEVRPNLCLLEMDTGGDSVEAIITADHVDRILQELRDQFTYVIVDCTSYKESVFTGFGLRDADKIVCCVPHEVSSAMWHISNEQFFSVLGPKTIYVDMDFKLGGTDFETLLQSIQVPRCLVRFQMVKSANYCENNGHLIVHQGGREEKRYKAAVMSLTKALLSLEEEDSSTAKKAKAKKEKRDKKKAREEAAKAAAEEKAARKAARGRKDPDDFDEDEEEEKPRRRLIPEREYRDIEGRQKVMGSREIRRSEELAILRAQEEQQRGYRRSDYNPLDDDDDDD